MEANENMSREEAIQGSLAVTTAPRPLTSATTRYIHANMRTVASQHRSLGIVQSSNPKAQLTVKHTTSTSESEQSYASPGTGER